MSKMHRMLSPHVWRQTIVVISVPTLFPTSMVQIVRVDCPRLHLWEPHCRLHVVVEIRHGGHGVHRSCHGRRRNRFRLLNTGLLETRVVRRNLRENKRSLHGPSHLRLSWLLGEGLVAVASTDGVTGVTASPAPLLLVFHVPAKHLLAGGHEVEPGTLELGGEERCKNGRGARVVRWEAAMVWLGHVLLRAGNGVECLQSIGCSPQQYVLRNLVSVFRHSQ
jgi:hypothetical protein